MIIRGVVINSVQDLVAAIDKTRFDFANAIAVVTVDDESKDVVNICGPFSTVIKAREYADHLKAEDDRLWEEGVPKWTYIVVPMFFPGT